MGPVGLAIADHPRQGQTWPSLTSTTPLSLWSLSRGRASTCPASPPPPDQAKGPVPSLHSYCLSTSWVGVTMQGLRKLRGGTQAWPYLLGDRQQDRIAQGQVRTLQSVGQEGDGGRQLWGGAPVQGERAPGHQGQVALPWHGQQWEQVGEEVLPAPPPGLGRGPSVFRTKEKYPVPQT